MYVQKRSVCINELFFFWYQTECARRQHGPDAAHRALATNPFVILALPTLALHILIVRFLLLMVISSPSLDRTRAPTAQHGPDAAHRARATNPFHTTRTEHLL